MNPRRDNRQRDLETLELLVASDQRGLRQLIEDHGGLVRSYLQRKFHGILDHAELDEAMSSAAIRIWQSAPRFDVDQGRLRAWFAVIARNCALRLMATRSRLPFVPIDHVDPWAIGRVAPHEAERVGFLLDLHRCIRELPPLSRDVILADIDHGAAVAAPLLAARFATTVASVWNARTTGRRQLRLRMALLGYECEVGRFLTANRLRSPEERRG